MRSERKETRKKLTTVKKENSREGRNGTNGDTKKGKKPVRVAVEACRRDRDINKCCRI